MANESFANTLQVSIDGTPLPADVATMLTQATVAASRNLPDACHLRFRDPERVLVAKTRLSVGGKIEVSVQSAEPGSPQRLMSGEVVALEIDIDAAGTFIEVRGLDPAHRLFRGRRVAAYPNMGLADVVRKVAQRAGLQVGTVDDVKGFGQSKDSQLSQDNVSDWEFLSRLADRVGAQVTASDGKLSFRLPDPPQGAPPESATAATDPLVLEPGVNLIALRAAVSAAEQVPEVNVRGWDFANKKELTASQKPTTVGSQVDGVDPVGMAGKFKAPPYLEAGTSLSTQGQVDAYAKALAAELGATAVELDGVAKGNPKLVPGSGVTLANVSDPFGGKYTLTSVRHVFNEHDGYTTAFTVSGRAERTLYGLTAGSPGPVPNGLTSGVVSDVRDPLKLGRVKVTFPWLSKDFTTTWARTASPGGGRNRGLWAVPEVGDEVLVGFADGDMDYPFVLGGLHSNKDSPPKLESPTVDDSSGAIGVRALVSRTGHRLELVDDASKQGILLSTGDGKLLLKLDAKGQLLELKCSGEIKVTGRGVKIDAGTGNLELSGQQVKVKGQSGVDVEGATVKVAGTGSAELSASGAVTVRGGVVRIN
ncbi:VgrG-related protein [Glycomyces sp. NPDC048151]|uniref:VgrG-related protein n=1 Tax=Glycomyces sp. NPDC048151 TaxID=3364002 RepID=UPI003715AEF0